MSNDVDVGLTLENLMELRRAALERYSLPPREIFDRDMETMSVADLARTHSLDEGLLRKTLEFMTFYDLGEDTVRAERVLARG